MIATLRSAPALALALAATSAACVDARTPPGIPSQAVVHYGPKVYLVDSTLASAPAGGVCTRLGEEALTSTVTTRTASITGTDGVVDSDGRDLRIPSNVPHNCFVNVTEGDLSVDQVEVTNDLFQLCVDSGACKSPDPSKASKGQVCRSEDQFDNCPVVEATHGQAKAFCSFIGRRLPSGLEHVIMRQAAAASTQNPTMIPIFPNGTSDKVPKSCSEGVVGPSNCGRPSPIDVSTVAEATRGAGSMDTTKAKVGTIFDLMGNVSEWSSDLLANPRGAAEGLPWFCLSGRLPSIDGKPPVCPAGQTCVYGQFQPTGMPIRRDYPVCVAFTNYRPISGAHGSLFGGNFADEKVDREHIGVFGRRVEMSPDDNALKEYGFRCVGDAVDDPDQVTTATVTP